MIIRSQRQLTAIFAAVIAPVLTTSGLGQQAAPDPSAHKEDEAPALKPAAVSSIAPEDLAGFEHYAPQVQQLVRKALDLTRGNLTYTFGSSDPGLGGMDCSGTIVHLLREIGVKGAPRQSDQIAEWVERQTLLHRPGKDQKLTDPQFAALNPGDLLFWSGTYESAPRPTPVTHVMLYLGKLKKTGKPVLFGASDGRAYEGQRRTGVSVFDFSLPKAGSPSAFYGYGLIPGIGGIKVESTPPELAASQLAAEEAKAAPTQAAAPPKEEVRKAVASKTATPAKPKAASKPKAKTKAPPKKK
jgi:cell wall-associated NlpC family hydrolase